jgi:trehalose synthase
MASRKHNALMVNALQRSSDIVVQNSLREGFGLTVSEAMWKRTPVLGPARAAGVRLQVRDGVDGRLVDDPEDVHTTAAVLHDMLSDSDRLDTWGSSAQRRVHDEFLVLGELVRWLRLLAGER